MSAPARMARPHHERSPRNDTTASPQTSNAPAISPDGTRALIEVLLLHRHLAHEHVVAGLTAALRAGGHTADVVALEARKAEDQTRDNSGASLTERRLRKPLPVDTRPPPTVDQYDQLLRRRSRAQE